MNLVEADKTTLHFRFLQKKKKKKYSKVFYCQVNFGCDGSRLVNQAYELRRALRWAWFDISPTVKFA